MFNELNGISYIRIKSNNIFFYDKIYFKGLDKPAGLVAQVRQILYYVN